MASVLVEQSFEQPVTDEALKSFAERIDTCLDLQDGAWVRSSLSADRMRMICEFEAPDADSVRAAYRSAGFAFERVWSGLVFRVEDYPEHWKRLVTVREKLAGRTG